MDTPLDDDLTPFGRCVLDHYVRLATSKSAAYVGDETAGNSAPYLRQITLQVGGIENLIETLAMVDPKTKKPIHAEAEALTLCKRVYQPLGSLENAAVTQEFRNRQANASGRRGR